MLGKRQLVTVSALTLAVLCTLLLIAASPAQAQTETVLYNFCSVESQGNCLDGTNPQSTLTSYGGSFYGTTVFGGTGVGLGTVFRLSPDGSGGWNESVLYNFCSEGGENCTDGAFPVGPVVFDSVGNLYGIDPEGGNSNCGYNQGCGVAFELSPVGAGWTETVVYDFCSQFTGGGCHDGADPGGGVVMDAAGNLYGQLTAGPFELSPSPGGWTEEIISPYVRNSRSALTMDAAGNMFGVALNGSGEPVAYELSPNGTGGWNTTVLYILGAPGATIWSSPALDQAGNLYGTSQGAGAKGSGTVYKLTSGDTGWTKKTLFTFTFANSAVDGFSLSGGLVLDKSENIYGTTIQGGTYGLGTVFELVPVGMGKYVERVLWNFGGADGSTPVAGVTLDGADSLIGTTSAGGSSGNGVVFNVTGVVEATTTLLASSANPSTYGQALTLTAVVTPSAGSVPDGEIVSFMKGKTLLGTGTLSGGSAGFTTSTLPAGPASVTAVYGGDSRFVGSTSNVVKQIVKKAVTTTALSSSPNPSTNGQAVTFIAVVTSNIGAPTNGETVRFEEGTTVLGSGTTSGGSASFTTSALPVGTDDIKAVYGGDTNFASSQSNTVKQLVKE